MKNISPDVTLAKTDHHLPCMAGYMAGYIDQIVDHCSVATAFYIFLVSWIASPQSFLPDHSKYVLKSQVLKQVHLYRIYLKAIIGLHWCKTIISFVGSGYTFLFGFGIIPMEILFTLTVLSARCLMDMNNRTEWVRCPVCGNKIRLQILTDTTYAGMKLKGKVETTVVRGAVIYENGELKVTKGYGRFIARHPIDTAVEV